MNKSAEFDFFYKVMIYINILHTNMKFKVLNQDYNFLIVYLNYNCLKSL